ncbi:MAG: carbamate kinase, partial [Acidimicrobiia bacterium]
MNVSDCIVVGLGGNALNRRNEPFTLQHQRERLTAAAAALIPALDGSPAVITHGNGPQIGALAVRASRDASLDEPLDVLGAESDAMIGYELELALRSVAPSREIVMVLTATEVDLRDRAFIAPSKPIGPLYSAETARRWADEHGWTMAPEPTAGNADADTGANGRWRRVVPSPEPVCIVELGAIARLIDAGVTVICAGGG